MIHGGVQTRDHVNSVGCSDSVCFLVGWPGLTQQREEYAVLDEYDEGSRSAV